ncbi:MAG: hypothetical protein EXS51_03225 [Candidatus Taylorbacteria bacterium]|nr:hypothetical protein [Candidatus Taylorbacteria bacterium]
MSSSTTLSWEEFGSIRFRGRDIHFTPEDGIPRRGKILKMEIAYAGVLGFVFVIKTRERTEKFVISTFLNFTQPERFENGRIKATNFDGTHCIIYYNDEEEETSLSA